MAKYKEIVYAVLDLLHETSDDSNITEEHIIFLASRVRSFLLKQRYLTDIRKEIPQSAYQTLCLDLEQSEAVEGLPCEGYYLKSTRKLPDTMPFGLQSVSPAGSFYKGEIAYISPDRMRYVGWNKWLRNITYASLSPDGYLYLTSRNPQHMYLKQVQFTGIFENAEEASKAECGQSSEEGSCDIMDKDFPIEDALVSPLIDLVIQRVHPTISLPEDEENNASDDIAPKATNTVPRPYGYR